MAKEFIHGKMVEDMKVIIRMIKKMDMVYIHELIVIHIFSFFKFFLEK